MLPNNKVTPSKKWIDDLNPPKNTPYPNTRSFCVGGADIGDTSEGVNSYVWQGWTDGAAIYIQRTDIGRAIRVLADKGITEVSIAFDRSMNLIVAYQAGLYSKLWVGRNGKLTGDIVVDLKGSITPRVASDDTGYGITNSDVIFAYVKDLALYCRYQKDGYVDDYKLSDLDSNTGLHRIGMSKDNRFLFLLKKEI